MMKSRKMLVSCAAIVLLGGATVAQAGPPVLPAITEVIDYASVGTAVAAAGGAILIVVATTAIGFRLVRALIRRVSGAV